MFDPVGFTTCIRENLKGRHFGKERGDKIVKDFETRAKNYYDAGHDNTTASTLAMRDVFTNLTEKALDKAKATAKMLDVQADMQARIRKGMTVDTQAFTLKDLTGKQQGPRGSRGVAAAHAIKSMIEDDSRFSEFPNYFRKSAANHGQMWAIMSDVLDKIGKGAFGLQKGAAYFPNIIKEVFGENTGDAVAAQIAKAWLKVTDVGVDLFNEKGGSMRKLSRYIPQQQNANKMTSAGEKAWVDDHMEFLDWNKIRYDDGSLIKDRRATLSRVYKTLTSNGAVKIDDTAMRGQGKSLGNAIDQHRFLHYKDADSWLKMHDKYGDGNVFGVMHKHIESMSHKIAMVDMFGRNPELAFRNAEAIVKKHAASISLKDKQDADKVLKNVVGPMFDLAIHNDPVDPNSKLAAGIIGTTNILNTALLNSAILLAAPGDFAQGTMVRALNGMDLFGSTDFYLKSLAADRKFAESIMAQTGFVHDTTVMSIVSNTRNNGLATHFPSITRRISDVGMRLNLITPHTEASWDSFRYECMGMLHRAADTSYDKLHFKPMLKRFGIDEGEWDQIRKNYTPISPRGGVHLMSPVQLLETKLKNKQQLYEKLQGMIWSGSREATPSTSLEATVALKESTKPDTWRGALLHSFANFKNFPLTIALMNGRLGMTSPSVRGRLGFYAGLGAAMTGVGALGVQMREMANLRDPMPMDTLEFYGKAFLAGGAMSIWGDFLFGSINQQGRSLPASLAGPLAAFAGDTIQLALGDTFQWAGSIGTLDQGQPSKFPAKLVEYASRYNPAQTFYLKGALQRELWDRLREIADPKAYQKYQRKMQYQQQQYGNEYFWPPGDRTPDRLPHYQGRN